MWCPATEADLDRIPANAIEAIAEALDGSTGLSIPSLNVVQGGVAATIQMFVRHPPMAEYKVLYAHPSAHQKAGLMRFAELPGGAITALADALRAGARRTQAIPVSLGLH